MKMRVIVAVMNTTQEIMKMKPVKKSCKLFYLYTARRVDHLADLGLTLAW